MLDPYRVLDFTDERGELGPMLLGDLGADVIRVEPPDGSAARRVLPSGPSESLSFQAFNRNKRSIVLHNGDRDVLESLVRSADCLFESALPSTLAPFRLDPDAVRTINPYIVHVVTRHRNCRSNDTETAGPGEVNLTPIWRGKSAEGGPVSLQEPRDRAPLRVGVPQVWRHTGAEAAIWTIIDNEFFVVGGAYGVLVLRLSVDGALCVAGLGWSLAIGAIGASVPAGRAVYMNVAATLREA